MTFRIEPGEPLELEVRRIAGHQIERAIAELSSPDDRHEAIHDIRKRFKKLRALLRLVRGGDETFARTENARFRDLAGALSAVRDRTALIESLDALEAHAGDKTTSDAFAAIRAALEQTREAALEAEGDLDARIASTVVSLQDSRDASRMLTFRLSDKKARALIAAGHARTHRDARRALKAAEKSGEPEDFHILRKHVKYLGAQLGLLSALWPEVLSPMRQTASAIGDDLGLDHDYAVFRAEADARPDAFGAPVHLGAVLALMDRRQAELRATSLIAARRLLAETPAAVELRLLRLQAAAAKAAKAARKTALAPRQDEDGMRQAAE